MSKGEKTGICKNAKQTLFKLIQKAAEGGMIVPVTLENQRDVVKVTQLFIEESQMFS